MDIDVPLKDLGSVDTTELREAIFFARRGSLG